VDDERRGVGLARRCAPRRREGCQHSPRRLTTPSRFRTSGAVSKRHRRRRSSRQILRCRACTSYCLRTGIEA
jgi:hypothetical protein